MQLYVVITLLTALGYGFQWYAFDYFKVGKQYWALENAIFATVHRLIYVVSYAFGAVVYVTSDLGKLYQYTSLIIECVFNIR